MKGINIVVLKLISLESLPRKVGLCLASKNLNFYKILPNLLIVRVAHGS